MPSPSRLILEGKQGFTYPRTKSRTCLASFSISSDLRIKSRDSMSVVSFSLSCFCNASTSSDIRVTSLAIAWRFAFSMARSRFWLFESSGGSGGANGGGNWGGGGPCCAAQRAAADAASESDTPMNTLRDERMATHPFGVTNGYPNLTRLRRAVILLLTFAVRLVRRGGHRKTQ